MVVDRATCCPISLSFLTLNHQFSCLTISSVSAILYFPLGGHHANRTRSVFNSPIGTVRLYFLFFNGEMMKTVMRTYVVVAFLLPMCSTNVWAGEVTGASVTLSRNRMADLSDSQCAFYTDIWGTTELFSSISLTTPAGYVYWLWADDDQWESEHKGTYIDITSIFTDGVYTFEVTYLDGTSESREVTLGGPLPEFPVNVVYDDGVITWDQWQDPANSTWIHVGIESVEDEGGVEGDWHLDHAATSFTVPPEFLEDDAVYELELTFVSNSYTNGYKESETTSLFSTAIGDINKDGRVNMIDFTLLAKAWQTRSGDILWNEACDLAEPVNEIGLSDLNVLLDQWLMGTYDPSGG